MLSTKDSTLIMELVDDEFNELPISDFYLEGFTIFACTTLKNSAIVQVYSSGFRMISNDSAVKTIFKYAVDSVFQIVSGILISDYILIILDERGTIKTFNLESTTKHNMLEGLEKEENIECLASCNYQQNSFVSLYYKDGTLKVNIYWFLLIQSNSCYFFCVFRL